MAITAGRKAIVHEGYHLARGTCSGVLFALPAIYTMELWWLAYDMPLPKLLGLVALTWVACCGLIREAGMQEDRDTWPHVLAAAVEALALGLLVAGAMIGLLGLGEGHHPAIVLRMAALLAAPIAIGYAVAAAMLGREDEEPARPAPGGPYWRLRDLAVVAAGCLFVGISIAPIEETVLTGPMLDPLQAVGIAAASWGYAALISYVAGVQGRHGRERSPEADHAKPWAAAFNTYAVGLLSSAAMLYFLGYAYGDQGWGEFLMMVISLAFPATVGGSAARLMLE